jgi:hypothetical protein
VMKNKRKEGRPQALSGSPGAQKAPETGDPSRGPQGGAEAAAHGSADLMDSPHAEAVHGGAWEHAGAVVAHAGAAAAHPADPPAPPQPQPQPYAALPLPGGGDFASQLEAVQVEALHTRARARVKSFAIRHPQYDIRSSQGDSPAA